MGLEVRKIHIEYKSLKVNALHFIPEAKSDTCAIFSHGYTSHKGSILNWAIRLAESKMSVIIFDLPGHFLGSFEDCVSFEEFTKNAHYLFRQAHENFCQEKKVVLGGHSLGALLSFKALNLPYFEKFETIGIGVGIGDSIAGQTHLFETELYKKALIVREQLISKSLCSDLMFSWIRDQKMNLDLKNKRVHIIVGQDDLVTPVEGAQVFVDRLQSRGATVSFQTPPKLPHHLPEGASGHIKRFLKDQNLI